MYSENKIKKFQNEILKWYQTNGRKFPWRKNSLSNYKYIIAEILLQRTRAETVAKFYPLFLQDFPTWKSLVEADIKVIEKRLKPVGLSKQRAVRLKNLSIEMLKRNGRLPKNRSELECIPYMGQYIANSVELIIFKRRVPLIDVNMARVLEYYFGKRKKIDIRYDPFLQNLAHKIVNHPKTIEINWAILDLGAVMQKTKDKFKFQDPITTHYNSYC